MNNNYIYPTETGIKFAIKQGWSKEEAERGFIIVDYEGIGLYHIERLDEAHVKKTECGYCYLWDGGDEEAAKEAERINYCKIIPVKELPNNFYYGDTCLRWFGWIDTQENRQRICDYCRYYNNR